MSNASHKKIGILTFSKNYGASNEISIGDVCHSLFIITYGHNLVCIKTGRRNARFHKLNVIPLYVQRLCMYGH